MRDPRLLLAVFAFFALKGDGCAAPPPQGPPPPTPPDEACPLVGGRQAETENLIPPGGDEVLTSCVPFGDFNAPIELPAWLTIVFDEELGRWRAQITPNAAQGLTTLITFTSPEGKKVHVRVTVGMPFVRAAIELEPGPGLETWNPEPNDLQFLVVAGQPFTLSSHGEIEGGIDVIDWAVSSLSDPFFLEPRSGPETYQTFTLAEGGYLVTLTLRNDARLERQFTAKIYAVQPGSQRLLMARQEWTDCASVLADPCEAGAEPRCVRSEVLELDGQVFFESSRASAEADGAVGPVPRAASPTMSTRADQLFAVCVGPTDSVTFRLSSEMAGREHVATCVVAFARP